MGPKSAQEYKKYIKRFCFFLQADHRQQIMPCICVKLDTKLPIHLLSWVALLCVEENCWTLHQQCVVCSLLEGALETSFTTWPELSSQGPNSRIS